jgi:pimeloyl-ACP methyl ester carboxylesterase
VAGDRSCPRGRRLCRFRAGRPGCGKSPPLELERYLASSVAEIGVALVDELAIAPAIWIGFSWGANIGIHAAVRNPDRFKTIVLLDSGYLIPADDPEDDPSLDFAGRMERWRTELDATNDESEAPRAESSSTGSRGPSS